MNSIAPFEAFQIVICSNEPGYYYDTAQDVCLPRDNAGIGGSKILVSIHSQYWLGSTIGLHLFPIDIHSIREGFVESFGGNRITGVTVTESAPSLPKPTPVCGFSEVARCTP